MNAIDIRGLTKDYGQDKGIFDLSFSVARGEVLGFLGANGAGKTTTIRHLMGFVKPKRGQAEILGLDCFKKAPDIQRQVGYLPGEIAFMDQMTGQAFIDFMARMKGLKTTTRASRLIQYLELDPTVKIKRMSKGMKQKIGLVVAFMADAPILILDEPTSGLDPLMQSKFVDLIRHEKAQGKTVLMSSHMFEEVEHTCDRVVMIKKGRIVADETMAKIKDGQSKHYEIRFASREIAESFAGQITGGHLEGRTVSFLLRGEVNALLRVLTGFDVEDINVRPQSLEEVFMAYYGGKVS